MVFIGLRVFITFKGLNEFIEFFKKQGEIKSTLFVEEKHAGYVDFTTSEKARELIEKFNKDSETEIGKIEVHYYKNKKERKREHQRENRERMMKVRTEYKEFNLYIQTKMLDSITESIVKEAFIDLNIFSLKLQYRDSKPTGVIFICFTNEEDKKKALDICKDKDWESHIFKSKADMHALMGQYPSLYPMNYFFTQPVTTGMPMMPYAMQQGMMPPQPKSKKQPKKENNSKRGQNKQKTQNKKPQPPAQPKVTITEEMKNELGDNLYTIIDDMGKYSEDDVGRITGVMLESFEYGVLDKMVKENGEELKRVINEVDETLKNMDKK